MQREEKTVGEMLTLFRVELASRYPVPEIKEILYRLFDSSMGWTRASVHLNKGKYLSGDSIAWLWEALRRLKAGEPVQYIIGYSEFCGLTLKVQPGVLIPRPETEEMAMLVARENQHAIDQHSSILDAATGSGCLALALKKAFPGSAVTGIDISEDALAIARENAASNRLEITFMQIDMLDPKWLSHPGGFDLIVSNPPYIPLREKQGMSVHVVDHEPETALFVPDDRPLLFYEALSRFACEHLKQNGKLYVEIHEAYGQQAVSLFKTLGFDQVILHQDFLGKNRVVRASATMKQ